MPWSTLRKDTARDGFPARGADGKWPVPAVKAWYSKRRKEPSKNGHEPEPDDVEKRWGVRYRAAKAQMMELGLAERRGELMEVSQHRRLLTEIATAWARVLRLRGRRLAATLVGRSFQQIKDALEADAEEMLGTFAGAETLEEAVAKAEAAGADDESSGGDEPVRER